jgi:F5/8 type C domain-containing protein
MPDNNGNLKQQDIQIPSVSTRSQYYEYDSLNRLKSAREVMSAVEQWKQQFTYDRWGNRLIDNAVTYGTGINNKAFTVNTTNNRLGVPVGQSGTLTYDTVGNLTNDTYTGAGNRTYDAENKIISAWGGNNQAQLYSYDSTGQRIKRTVNGTETWQVYGFGGELMAEYPANGLPASPQKEYGYRNGQLLITAGGRTNVALSANGGVASASSAHTCCGFSVGGAINGNVRGPWGNGEGWNDATENVLPDWFQVDFAGTKTIDEIDVFSLHDNYTEPNTPTETQTFSLYGLVNFEVQYWNGTAWVTIPGGSVSGNNKVWRKFIFAPITTSKIRLWITSVPDSWSRLVELQAWAPQRSNFALASAGGVASASSTLASPPWVFAPAGANNGNRSGAGWGSGEGWNDNSPANTFPDWLQIDFNGSKTIDEINVLTVQDNWQSPSEPTEAMTFSVYGLTGYDVQYWNGSSWVTVTGGSVSGNNKVWRKFTFAPITTTKIRVLTNASVDGYSRIIEVEAWGPSAGATSNGVQWLVTDHLGTPRMILDQTGSLASMKRHDYLPFGEELGSADRRPQRRAGYAGGDGVRQQFSQNERSGISRFRTSSGTYDLERCQRFFQLRAVGDSCASC